MKSRSTVSRLASPPARGRKAMRAGDQFAQLSVPGRAKRSTHRRSTEILEAAARVFAERGYHGATTQDIADVLGIRQASLYYYFPSKEVALELVCLQGVGGFFEVAKAIASGPGSAADKLTRLIKSHLSPLPDRRDLVRGVVKEPPHLPRAGRRR